MATINISYNYPTLFINRNNGLSHKAEAYAKVHYGFVHIIDFAKQTITAQQIAEVIQRCNARVGDLFDRTADFYQQKVKHTSNFSQDDLIQLLADNPTLFRTPFVVKGNLLRFFASGSDLAIPASNLPMTVR